ncbi:MAG: hypothetical protein PVSMB2_35460 [Ktedonobacteraceae bacterium]
MSQRITNSKLIQARQEKNWTQSEACEAAGVADIRSWQRWELEGMTPSSYYRRKLCSIFNKTAEELGFLTKIPKDASTDRAEVVTESNVLLTTEDEQLRKSQLINLLTQEQVAVLLPLLELRESEMAHFDESKRQALRLLIELAGMAVATSALDLEPWERLSSTKPLDMDTNAFTHFKNLMSECWELGKSQLTIADRVLTGFLPDMIELAPYHREAAFLATQGLRLRSILTAHQLNLSSKVTLCQKAVDHARTSGDLNSLVAALTELGVAYKYANQHDSSITTYQEALHYSGEASPLLRTRVYAAAAAALAQHGRKKEADFYIHLAYEDFPENPTTDPSFTYADSGIYMIAFYEGVMRLGMDQPAEAYQAFENYKNHPASAITPERNRLEIINQQGKAAIMLNNLEQYVDHLEQGITGAIALKSKKRFDEVVKIFQETMPKSWLDESQIKHIAEQYKLLSGVN